MPLLRGFLNADLIEAENLPNKDIVFFNHSDPFVQIILGTNVICKTDYVKHNLSPKWKESHRIPVCHVADELRIQVLDRDNDGLNAQFLGEVTIGVEDLLKGKTLNGWYPLTGCKGQMKLELEYVPKESIKATFEVPDCYFKLREDCKVTPYQDAHCPPLPIYESIPTANGETYKAACVWTDLYKALKNAQKFIYVAGWSVNTKTTLVRSKDNKNKDKNEDNSIGKLLKDKAKEGVRVLVMVWNERLSTDLRPQGLMGTHDVDTEKFFRNSNVEVAVVPRYRFQRGGGGAAEFVEDQFEQTCYSHHQKTVILDIPPLEGEMLPRIQAFIGGLDITDGRYDTPEHELFRTLKNLHDEDFYNGTISTPIKEFGPRQPWHDIHCRLDGPIVWDVLANFEDRWRQQVRDKQSCLLKFKDFALHDLAVCDEGNSWNTQLFRSITSDSAMFDFDRISTVPKRKGRYVDDSIHRAHIHHIRRADSFLFIENQYFLGSAYGWKEEQDIKAHHLIPMEIAHRIVEKMNAGQHFAVYVIVPMFPEGVPTSGAVQEILHWQHRTMEMMYREIAQAIKANELDTRPTDYLSFFCLGKGECPDEIPEDLPVPRPGTDAAVLRKQARHMIYVHSKMMIVDDDYIIIGSANINQRSMGGTRDSEIAVGCFQPLHTREVSGEPRGAVHEFRMSLWAEHLNGVKEIHQNPGTLECMRAVKKAAYDNWCAYAGAEPCKVDGHLLRYPVEVFPGGSVEALLGCEYFPDTKAQVLGASTFLSKISDSKLTT